MSPGLHGLHSAQWYAETIHILIAHAEVVSEVMIKALHSYLQPKGCGVSIQASDASLKHRHTNKHTCTQHLFNLKCGMLE